MNIKQAIHSEWILQQYLHHKDNMEMVYSLHLRIIEYVHPSSHVRIRAGSHGKKRFCLWVDGYQWKYADFVQLKMENNAIIGFKQ